MMQESTDKELYGKFSLTTRILIRVIVFLMFRLYKRLLPLEMTPSFEICSIYTRDELEKMSKKQEKGMLQ